MPRIIDLRRPSYHPPVMKTLALALFLWAFCAPVARADWPEFRGPQCDGHVSALGDTKPLGNGASMNCYATPSPAIEPGRVYVHFGSFGTACLDTKTGKTIWRRDDLRCRHYRGPSSSVVLFENLVILTFDGADLQYHAALDKA